ncbi:hypothetical protein SDRG_17344 [Saprolegnia diclina VS20]|uniref:Uncharacterized protein n=1 Tax=Saprolegnia diclina (strain VS20) TaxID=1156394 RepID=T0QYC8_SAPDV|nr:hypothetical protein SDRG_17344 [Saprolegnia diclina VS20]EQC24763.1 hypothetical protein SDRG_17344 [Saprolegnia diclina VS20]|eukprot:XP_008621807.1 hypothetical protein SDRG_17344 [Saprolegnia diclina VS20]
MTHQVAQHLSTRLQLHLRIAHERINIALREARLPALSAHPPDSGDLDEAKIERISQLVLRQKLTPEATVRLLRGQCVADPRPNKALFPAELERILQGYPHRADLLAVAAAGFAIPTRSIALPPPSRQKNHKSAEAHGATVRKHLADGQARNEYAFFTQGVLDAWSAAGHNIHLSPLGLVPKNDASLNVDGRVIHDLSAPAGLSVNDATDKDLLPDVRWRRITEVASRIIALHLRLTDDMTIVGMAGDVKSAFRHLRVAAADAHWLGAQVPGSSHWGLDLSGPFGWCGSPPYYVVFGRAISHLVSQESPHSLNPWRDQDTEPFWTLEWMDDHILIELVSRTPDGVVPIRASAAETSLRLAMLAILGPTSINEKKFKAWSSDLHALGLIWHLNDAAVSMPPGKVEKAKHRVDALVHKGTARKTDLLQALGSLRHVCSCAPAARAFYQRLHNVAVRADKYKTFRLPPTALRDLELFQAILAQADFARVPAAIFDRSSEPDLHLDASAQPPFSINVREHLSLCLAVSIWAPLWAVDNRATVHVHGWIDNASSVAWTNKLAAESVFAQELNRRLALAQAVHRLHVTAGHMEGARNTMAYHGSRSLEEPHRSAWRRLATGWQAWEVPAHLRFMYRQSSATSKTLHWPRAREEGYHPWLSPDQREQSNGLINYVLYLRDQGNSAGTIRSKLCGVAWHHQVHRGYNVALEPDHQLVLRGIERTDGPAQRKEPVSIGMLWQMRAGLDFNVPQQRSLWGAALLGFFFLLRKSEYLHEGARPAMHGIRVKDVRFTTRFETLED